MTSLLLNKQVIAAQPAAPPRYGLFIAADEILPGKAADGTLIEERWQWGTAWAPEQNNGGGTAAVDCAGRTTALTAGTNVSNAKADPFLVWSEDHCSTIGFKARDYLGRAKRQLAATESFRAASELWLGTEAQAVTLDNHWLTEDPEILKSGTAFAPLDALALIDMGLGRMLAGRRGMIHVSQQLMVDLHANFGLEQSGDKWITPTGNVVVSDAGYPGTKPDAASGTNQWIYATPMIQYRRSPVDVVPGSFDTAYTEAMDRGLNTITVRAERLVLLQWDSTVPVGNHSNLPVLTVETTVPAFAFAA